MAEKTEKASPKKLRDARKKGQVAKAQDLPSAFTFIVSIWVLLGVSSYLYNYLGGFLVSLFHLIPQGELDTLIPALYKESLKVILISSLPSLLFVSSIGVIVTFLAVGPVFSMEAMKFDIKKLNPVDNLKQKFKLKTLVELLKSVLKISIACIIIYQVVYSSIPVLIKTVSMPISGAVAIFNQFLLEVVIKVGIFFVAVAVADYIYTQRNFANEMKMEKFEVKQEYKNTEGDPQIKSKRRHMMQEIVYQEGPLASLKRAKALITNPTHLAVAIAYEAEIDPAPYILCMGKDRLAEQMVKIADQLNLPIVRNIGLAHKLWEEGEEYDFVPEGTYEALAEILRWLASLETQEKPDEAPSE
jgi:type III secretion protein U